MGENLTREQYEQLFSHRQPGQVAGEGTTHYLHLAKLVAPRMAQDNPDLRLVFCVRNPVDRALSHLNFAYSRMGPYMIGGAGNRVPFAKFVRDPEIFEMGNYAGNLAIFEQHFPKEQLLLVFDEDIKRDFRSVLAMVCRHIGVSDGFNFDLTVKTNHTRYPKYPLLVDLSDRAISALYPHLPGRVRNQLLLLRRRVLFAPGGIRARLSSEQRADALELYRPSIWRLAEMTGRDLSGWLDRPADRAAA